MAIYGLKIGLSPWEWSYDGLCGVRALIGVGPVAELIELAPNGTIYAALAEVYSLETP